MVAATIPMPSTMEPSFIDRFAVWTAWAIAGGIFLTLGWLVMAPDDPMAPVSLLARSGAAAAWGQSLALACVVGVAGTVIAGRRVPELGVFSAGLGLTVVSFRGSTIEALLYRAADPTTWTERHVAMALGVETIAWGLLLGLVAILCGIVGRWCHGSGRAGEASLIMHHEDRRQEVWTRKVSHAVGLRHTGIVLLVSLVGFRVFSTGLDSRSIQHGQACFVVAASVALGVYTAMRFFPVDSPRWAIPAALLMGVAGYLLAGIWDGPTSAARPVNIPGSHFLRVLPIQYAAVGAVSAIATFWNLQAAEPAVGDIPSSASRDVP